MSQAARIPSNYISTYPQSQHHRLDRHRLDYAAHVGQARSVVVPHFVPVVQLIVGASGRMLSTSAHASNGRRTASAVQSSNSESLGSAIKLGQVARDKERREREDVELKPPWDLLPYSRDASAGNLPISLKNFSQSRLSRLLSFKGNGRGV